MIELWLRFIPMSFRRCDVLECRLQWTSRVKLGLVVRSGGDWLKMAAKKSNLCFSYESVLE